GRRVAAFGQLDPPAHVLAGAPLEREIFFRSEALSVRPAPARPVSPRCRQGGCGNENADEQMRGRNFHCRGVDGERKGESCIRAYSSRPIETRTASCRTVTTFCNSARAAASS